MKPVSSASLCDVRAVKTRLALSIAVVSVASSIAACRDSPTTLVCSGVAYGRPSVPDTTTLRAGASITATA